MKTETYQARIKRVAGLRAETAKAKEEWEAAKAEYENTDNQTDAKWDAVMEKRERYLDLANAN